MRRPLVYLFLAFAAGIVFQFFTQFRFIALTLAGIGVISLLIYSFRLKKRTALLIGFRRGLLLVIVMILGSSFFSIAEMRTDPLENWAGRTVMVQGSVLSVQKKGNDSYNLLVKSLAYENPDNNRMYKWTGKWLVQVKDLPGRPADIIGQAIQVTGKIEIPSPRRNPGLFDYRLYLKTKGVRTILLSYKSPIYLLNGKKLGAENLMLNRLAIVKYGFMGRLEKAMEPEAYGLLVGMLFGDRSQMSEDTYEAFQKNGIAHILSVSGIHVGIVYLYLNKIFGSRRSRLGNLAAIIMLVGYAALAEFSPSVVRAVVMIVVHILAKLTNHRYDFTSCASASAMIMLLINPYYLFNTGFQLSYMAVFCLAVQLPWFNRLIEILEENRRYEFPAKILNALGPLLVIQLGMAPLTAYMFNYFSIASFFMNIPIIALSGMIIPIGMSLILLSFFSNVLFGVGAASAELLIHLMAWLNQFFYFPGIGFFTVVSPSAGFIFIFYVLLFVSTSEFVRVLYQRKNHKAIASITAFFLSIALIFIAAADPQYYKSELIFLDVGQGDCLHLRTPKGKNLLIDGGGSSNYNVGEKTLLPYLLKNKVRSIDIAIATHLHDDHYLGLTQLAQQMEIKKFGIYQANIAKEQEIKKAMRVDTEDLIYLQAGDRLDIEEGVWIDVLYPEGYDSQKLEEHQEEDENGNSLLLKIHYMGLTVLMTGDIGTEGEEKIINYYEQRAKTPQSDAFQTDVLQSDILKIGHHGSRYSTGDNFLQRVNPKVAVFQVGKNNFGHPSGSVIEKCADVDIIIVRNDHDGAIILDKEDKEWHIRTLLKKNMHLKE